MRIVIIPSWYPTQEQPHAGGFVRSMARAVAEAGVDVTVLFPELRSLREWRPGAGTGELIETQDGPIGEMRWRGYRWWPNERHGTTAFASAARRLMCEYVSRREAPDLIHAHVVLPAGAAAAQIAGIWGVPLVLTEHAGPFEMMTQTWWQRRGVRGAAASAAAITAVSPALAEAMRGEGVSREIEIVPNTLDDAFVEPPPAAGRRDGARFISIGSLSTAKGMGDLLQAFARVASRIADATLTLAGEGPERNGFMALTAELGLSDRVRFPGLLRTPRDVRAALVEADCFVLASHAETFGVSIIEAMACGLPVVATRCGGPESIVTPVNGRLVTVGNIGELAGAMEETIRERARFDARATIDDCLTRFGPAAVAQKYVAIYERARVAFAAQHSAGA